VTDPDQYGVLLSDPVWQVDSAGRVWSSPRCRAAGNGNDSVFSLPPFLIIFFGPANNTFSAE